MKRGASHLKGGRNKNKPSSVISASEDGEGEDIDVYAHDTSRPSSSGFEVPVKRMTWLKQKEGKV